MDNASNPLIDIIRQSAAANDVDPAILLNIGRVESGLNPSAGATTSSAKGLFQFTNPTWKQYGQGGDVLDPAANADAGARFLRDNLKTLRDAGLPVTPGTAYLAHFAGPGGAVSVLKADPSAPAASVLDPSAIKANPFLRNMSVGDLKGWADTKMGGAGTAGVPASGAPAVPAVAAAPSGINPAATAGMLGLTSAGGTDQLNQGLAALPGLLGGGGMPGMGGQQQQGPQPLPPINFPMPPGIARARMLAALQARSGNAGG